jgi:hypothetical protein
MVSLTFTMHETLAVETTRERERISLDLLMAFLRNFLSDLVCSFIYNIDDSDNGRFDTLIVQLLEESFSFAYLMFAKNVYECVSVSSESGWFSCIF